MPVHLFVRAAELVSAAPFVLRSGDGTSDALTSLRAVEIAGRELLAPMRTADALGAFVGAWQPVLVVLVAHAQALAAGLAYAGHEYARIDAGLAALAAAPLSPGIPRS